MSTHENYIQAVAALAIEGLGEEDRRRLAGIKLVYGAGESGTRGITYFDRWGAANGDPRPFVEICAFGQEGWVQVAGTTLHELAHVLAGWNAGHGPDWQAACKRLGLRCAKAAGTCYHRALFTPRLREAIEALPRPVEGEPVKRLGSHMGPYAPGGLAGQPTIKPCGAGVGTRGGKSRGKGSGSRLRLWVCGCTPPVKVRVASDAFRAACLDCTRAFQRA